MITLHTSLGDIELELDFTKAPETAANFKRYAEEGHYDDTIFHRVIDGFMVQAGGFDREMEQKDTRAPIQNEADNGLKNELGTIAMARTPDPHSASAQFFINVRNNPHLNHQSKTQDGWGYCVFGKVSGGMDVVEKIEKVETGSRMGHQNVPLEPIIITSVTIAD